MIRFIDIGDQIFIDGETKSFAWFDTITDEFLIFSDCQAWDSWNDFVDDYNFEKDIPEILSLNRFKHLFPKERRGKFRSHNSNAPIEKEQV